MSSFKNVAKARQRTHLERGQPESRAHLGMLEKKKDYKQRAEEFQKKKNSIKALKRKALDKNPDEFYFNMVKTQKLDGVHQERETSEPQHTDVQLKLMQSQDLRYVTYKRTTELKKIERLKASLHLLDAEDKPKNKHIIFVDSKKEAKHFDAAKHFDTHPSLVNRAYNRLTLDMLEKMRMPTELGDEELEEISEEKEKKYKELSKRIHREKELHIIAQKLEVKKQLMDKKLKKKKVQDETKVAPAQYRWCFQRKK